MQDATDEDAEADAVWFIIRVADALRRIPCQRSGCAVARMVASLIVPGIEPREL